MDYLQENASLITAQASFATGQHGFVRLPSKALLLGAAPIDWCEPNLPLINPLGIKELHNTWTTAAYAVAGLVLLAKHWKALRALHECGRFLPLFVAFCAAMVMTGVTSAWFHATLVYAAQKSDEFCENVAVICLFYMTAPSAQGPRRVLAAAVMHSTLFGLGVLCIPELFCELHLIICVLCLIARPCTTLRVAQV